MHIFMQHVMHILKGLRFAHRLTCFNFSAYEFLWMTGLQIWQVVSVNTVVILPKVPVTMCNNP